MIGNLLILFEAPALGLQLLIDGILIGAVFALAAYGMALVWGVTNIVNVCQGEFVMLGGFITVLCAEQGVPPLLAVPVAAAALYLLGWVLFQTVIVHLVGRDMFNSVLATFGIAIILQQLMARVFGSADRMAESGLGSWFFFDGLVGVAKCWSLPLALRSGSRLRCSWRAPAKARPSAPPLKSRARQPRSASRRVPFIASLMRSMPRSAAPPARWPRWPTPSTLIASSLIRSAPS
jgi:branched-chain amino acid transport system permease protein